MERTLIIIAHNVDNVVVIKNQLMSFVGHMCVDRDSTLHYNNTIPLTKTLTNEEKVLITETFNKDNVAIFFIN